VTCAPVQSTHREKDDMVTEQTERAPVAVARPTMALSGISKRYGAVAALTDVSMEVLPGEVHALLGENGAGKSTLMGVASGTTKPDTGIITVDGDVIDELTPARASQFGIAIVHQHPAVLPDMTVAENIRVAVPGQYLDFADDEQAAMQQLLDDVNLAVHLEDRVTGMSVAQMHLLELAKALALRPRMLILDEPTAPLGGDAVRMLFDRVRTAAREGTAVVYITHRLAEVRELASRVTVLRDGRNRGTVNVDEVSDEELLALIIGRELQYTFPPKHAAVAGEQPLLEVAGLSGPGFSDVSLTGYRGEIIGVAGVVGNGQPELLRALAGLARFSGEARIGDRSYSAKELHDSAAFMPGDRHHEGLMMSMSVRENAAIAALKRLLVGPFVSRRQEIEAVGKEVRELRLKARSLETPVTDLSGGNQQKVVMARALLSEPEIVLADEPTQGVDVGARAELYRILREVSVAGVPVIVASSDAKELEGLCDRVIVMSRGHVVATLSGDEVTEERMIRAAVESTTLKEEQQEQQARTARVSALRRRLEGDYAPVAILASVMVVLAVYIYLQNARYFNAFNVTSVMLLSAALGFIALGQTIALMIGGIDLSVGPLAGFLVVVGSFFLGDDSSGPAMVLGLVLMVVLAAMTGAVNGSLIRFGNFTAVAATLATYIALQGFSNLLRDRPGGLISGSVTDAITVAVGPVPVAFILLVVLTAVLEYALRKSGWGLRLRAVGSREEAARSLGVATTRTVVLAYVAVSLLTFLGALVLLSQLGIGDPAQGIGYTLTSITAVVVGGTSLLGGRGSFVGTLLGTGLIIQLLNATTFLGLSQTWQYIFQGGLIVIAAIVYSQIRGTRHTAAAH
jgi:ABC-type sugar transport system ATPase subunit/ribose/xylose/arabinose/galactoside ABC-type transport system permease subunit